MNGLETLEAIKSADIDFRIILLTVSDNEKNIVSTLRAGADGYLLKDMKPEHMLEKLHQMVNGHVVLSKKVSEIMVHGLHEEHRRHHSFHLQANAFFVFCHLFCY